VPLQRSPASPRLPGRSIVSGPRSRSPRRPIKPRARPGLNRPLGGRDGSCVGGFRTRRRSATTVPTCVAWPGQVIVPAALVGSRPFAGLLPADGCPGVSAGRAHVPFDHTLRTPIPDAFPSGDRTPTASLPSHPTDGVRTFCVPHASRPPSCRRAAGLGLVRSRLLGFDPVAGPCPDRRGVAFAAPYDPGRSCLGLCLSQVFGRERARAAPGHDPWHDHRPMATARAAPLRSWASR
jgi:hypothetical protein